MSDESQSPSLQEALPEAVESAEQGVEATSEDASVQAAAQDAQATLKDPKASKTEKKIAQKMLKTLTLKLDGEEFEEQLPFEIPDDPKAIEYMKRELQMGKMGQKRAQEKAVIEKEVLRFIQDLQAGGARAKKALSDPAIGLDLKQLAAQIIEEEIENSKKSPDQLEREKLQAELQALKEERENEKQTSNQKEFERIKEQEYERYDVLISQALEKSDLPKSPAVVKKIADYMLIALESGKDVSPEDVLPLVREEIINDYKELLNSLPDEEIEKFIGKERINNIRKKNIAKAKQGASNPAVKAATKAPSTGKTGEAKTEAKKQTLKDFFKF
jgi:hypothetical protein